MRNITFNESSVLTEFLRIAEEKNLLGLKKEAEAPVPQKNPLTMALSQLNDYWAQLLTKMPESRAKPLFDRAVVKTVDMLKKRYRDPESHKKIDEFEVQAKKIAEHTRMLLPELDLSKSAKKGDSKVYDVTGETGKDLIDSAHPGNTRTELTHSKTDENLVETIFEQQEKDIEVAHSVPTGVYAALTELADGLDKLGYTKEADAVDDMIKKASDSEVDDLLRKYDDHAARKFIDLLEDKLPYANRYKGQLKIWASKYPSLSMDWVGSALLKMAKGEGKDSEFTKSYLSTLREYAPNEEGFRKWYAENYLPSKTSSEIHLKKARQGTADEDDRTARVFIAAVERNLSYFTPKEYEAAIASLKEYPRLRLQWVQSRIEDLAKRNRSVAEAFGKALSIIEVYKKTVQPQEEFAPDPELTSIPEKELELAPIPAPKTNRIKRWQGYYNMAVKGTPLENTRLVLDGIKGEKTRAAIKRVRDSEVKTLAEFRKKIMTEKPTPSAPPAPISSRLPPPNVQEVQRRRKVLKQERKDWAEGRSNIYRKYLEDPARQWLMRMFDNQIQKGVDPKAAEEAIDRIGERFKKFRQKQEELKL